ncbi:UDP-N-acetylmuramoyl-L-alanyl-D-glutamate--2,6-diaminopimelate ligase [Candidatus Dependentiae bacterium]|nr:UDP-N-acetylmuramoyl-L-alanyl-D-glutamate--2,6-diaminopimelate ligase [Candidatus Dependentiae bacterium]
MKTDLAFSFLPVTCDSTKTTKGSTFVACDGTRLRGIDFIPSAIQQGATRIIADIKYQSDLEQIEQENPAIMFSYVINPRQVLAEEAAKAHGYPAKKLRVIGVTGTKGKSSTTHLIEHILKTAGHKTALIGGVANKILDTKLQSSLTTPNSDFLQAFFAACVEQGVDTVVMEVSSHALSLDRTYGIEFDTIGFTNLAPDHLDFYDNSMQAYCDAKLLLFNQLKSTGKAIINLDHIWRDYVVANATQVLESHQIITLSSHHQEADTRMSIKENNLDGLHLLISQAQAAISLNLSSTYLFGIPYAYNIAMAALICQSMNISNEVIAAGISSFAGTPGRLQLHVLKNGAKAFVDFAHNGPSMEAVLQMLRPLTDNLIVVFGCGGDRPKERRQFMAQSAAKFSDQIIITEDNPRTEDRFQILRDVAANIPTDALKKTRTIQDRREAINSAVKMATTPSSIVAILGKGHEPYQIIGTTYYHFDDYEEIRRF